MATLTKEDRMILKRNYNSYVEQVRKVRDLTPEQETNLLLTFNNAARVLEEGHN